MRVDNTTGVRNLCAVAVHLQQTMQVNAATKFAIRTVLREAINKSNTGYRGNINRKNCRFISHSAEKQLAVNSGESLVADHAIPVSLLLREFESIQPLSVEGVVTLVAKYAVMVLITRDEDNCLRKAGLVKSMPAGWDGQELLARYRHINIQVKTNPLFQTSSLGGG